MVGFDLGKNCRVGVDDLPFVERPVHHHCFADDIALRHKSPTARIIAQRAIVTHDKVLAWWYFPDISNGVGSHANVWLIEHDPIDTYSGAINADYIPW